MSRITIAKISHKRRPAPGAPTVCRVACGECGAERSVLYAGWTALVCSYCTAEMYRYQKGADKARAEAPRTVAILGEPGERRNGCRLVWVTCGDCGAVQMGTYGDHYSGWTWDYLICQACRIEMWRELEDKGEK